MQVVPLTSNTTRIYPGEALVDVAGQPGKALASQLATASKLRVGSRLAVLSVADLQRVEQTLRTQLGLIG